MPALLFQVAVATTPFALLENISVSPAATLATYYSQNVTIPISLSILMFGSTYALTASTRFKADFGCNNMSKIK